MHRHQQQVPFANFETVKNTRLLSGLRFSTLTSDLFEANQSLSIKKIVAYHNLVMVHEIVSNGRPFYLAERLQLKTLVYKGIRGQGERIILQSDQTLSGGFVWRGGKLFNMLILDLWVELQEPLRNSSREQENG